MHKIEWTFFGDRLDILIVKGFEQKLLPRGSLRSFENVY